VARLAVTEGLSRDQREQFTIYNPSVDFIDSPLYTKGPFAPTVVGYTSSVNEVDSFLLRGEALHATNGSNSRDQREQFTRGYAQFVIL